MAGSAAEPQGSASEPPLRVLVDTNVVIDVVLAREPRASQAKPIFDARDAGRARWAARDAMMA